MNYLQPERLNALAAEYVVGTLRGQARVRYQKLMMQYQAVSEATSQWEQYLDGFSQSLPPVSPPADVWETIQQRLGHTKPHAYKDAVVDFEQAKQARWKGVSLLATAAALVLAVLLVTMQPTYAPDATQVAVVNNEENTPLWLIEISSAQMDIKTTQAFTALSDKDYELWMVPANGQAPISLGLLPELGNKALPTPDILLDSSITALAVSLEQPGGSVTGAPTEVLFVAPLLSV